MGDQCIGFIVIESIITAEANFKEILEGLYLCVHLTNIYDDFPGFKNNINSHFNIFCNKTTNYI